MNAHESKAALDATVERVETTANALLEAHHAIAHHKAEELRLNTLASAQANAAGNAKAWEKHAEASEAQALSVASSNQAREHGAKWRQIESTIQGLSMAASGARSACSMHMKLHGEAEYTDAISAWRDLSAPLQDAAKRVHAAMALRGEKCGIRLEISALPITVA
jgi:hypothetical protein